MNAAQLQRSISTDAAFPVLPEAALAALRLTETASEQFADRAAALALDPALRDSLAKAAGMAAERASVRDLALRLGPSRFRHLVFGYSCARLFPQASGQRVDRAAFWTHAFACGAMAEALAERLGSTWTPHAFAAGLLHDIGKLTIDAQGGQGYSKVHAMARAKGVFVLEAERLELGVDHALVGKWVCERWGLPEPVVLAVWLHHHETSHLETALFPTELVDIVALANLMAHRRAAGTAEKGRVSDQFEERRRHLGLEVGDLEAIMKTPVASPREAPRSPVTEDEHRDEGKQRKLEHELAYQKAMVRLLSPEAPVDTRPGALAHMARVLREDLGICAGVCYAVDRDAGRVEGAFWRDGLPGPRSVSAPVEVAEDDALHALLRALEAPGADGAPRFLHGLAALPLRSGEQVLGQIVFETTAPDEDQFARLHRFALACGAMLGRCGLERRREARSEMLATELLRQELGYRQSLREERLASVGRMAAGAAHEINNPLAVIAGRAQILLSRSTSEEDSKALETIVQQSRRASKILIDLMQFARPSQPKLEAAPLSHCVHQVVTMLAERLRAAKIEIVEDYAPNLPRVRFDRHQMEQVFLNLIVNAEQAMAGKGGRLKLRVGQLGQSNTICVQVSDTGCGIPSDRIDRIFEPFFTAREEGAGTGLGLAVCHGIIENHRGSITVHSVPGEGTTFTVTLPAMLERPGQTPAERARPVRRILPARTPTAEPKQESAPAPVSEAPAPTPQTPAAAGVLLVAEEDEALREVLQESLRARGYKVSVVGDGLEALAAALGESIDLVLLDTRLTGVDDAPVLTQLRERKPGLPVIGLLDRDTRLDPEEAGLRAALRKPFEMRALLAAIEQILPRRGAA